LLPSIEIRHAKNNWLTDATVVWGTNISVEPSEVSIFTCSAHDRTAEPRPAYEVEHLGIPPSFPKNHEGIMRSSERLHDFGDDDEPDGEFINPFIFWEGDEVNICDEVGE
jgi:hypothetical protein